MVDYCPQKEDSYSTRVTVVRNLINNPGNIGTPMTYMITSKLLLNSILSTSYVKLMEIDIENFYLNIPMAWYEYIILSIDTIPHKIIDEYQLMNKVKNGFIICENRWGVYGLSQAGIIANIPLKERLAKHGQPPCEVTPGIWKHDKILVIWCSC